MDIFSISTKPELLDQAVDYIWSAWGSDKNFRFYQDCIKNSIDELDALPLFHAGLVDDKIVSCSGLITNDLISRQDLFPWFSCLYVSKEFRGRGFAGKHLDHALAETKRLGFQTLYLSTSLEGFYEQRGWSFLADGFHFDGCETKIYKQEIAEEH